MTVEDLTEYGVEQLDAAAVHEFLATQRVGVLGLPTEDLPYMIPLSYGYDGEEYIYFTYIVGDSSQKTILTEEKTRASFLVYDAPSETNWTSVALEGTLSSVPAEDLDTVADAVDDAWSPIALEAAKAEEDTRVYRFWIQHERGISHGDMPPDPQE